MTLDSPDFLSLSPEVREALGRGLPVVALESTIICHGLPFPTNLETARGMEEAVRSNGSTPATIAVIKGRARIGLALEEIEWLATSGGLPKAGTRDLGPRIALGESAATTVSATVALAAMAGIRVMATGGIGGVHQGFERSGDVSADLQQLARSPVLVVSSGAKSILDLSRTLEYLETLSVPVIGYRTQEFPAFYARSSGLDLEFSVATPAEAAAIFRRHLSLSQPTGILLVHPISKAAALPEDQLRAWTAEATESAAEAGVSGKALTPYLLSEIRRLSGGSTLRANRALAEANAALAARVAAALTRADPQNVSH